MAVKRPPLLLTRPRAQSASFAEACRARLGEDLTVIVSPLLSIRFTGAEADLSGIAAIVATSANGIEGLAQGTDLAGRVAYCVGDATAAAARAAGMRAVSAQGDAGALIALLVRERPEGRLLYARGAEVRTDLAAALGAEGITIQPRVVYDQRPQALSRKAEAVLRGGGPVVLPLFSPRSAVLACKAVAPHAPLLWIAAISEAVAAEWTGPRPERLAIARRPDSKAMIDAVAWAYDGASS